MNTILNFSPIGIFLIMLGIGMNVNTKSFFEVFKNLKVLITGLLSQIIILPVIGFLFAILAPIDPVLKVGVILITCVPSAVTSNYITKLIGGNVALSVSLTAVTACFSFLTIPFILLIVLPNLIEGANVFEKLNFTKTSLSLLLITTLPVFLGIFINTKFSKLVEKVRKIYSIFSLFSFLIIVLAAWYSEWNAVIDLYISIGVLVILLAVAILISSFTLVNLLNLNEANKKTIIIESFIQNAAMAIVVGGTVFEIKSGYLAIAVLYALVQYKILFLLWISNKFFQNFSKS